MGTGNSIFLIHISILGKTHIIEFLPKLQHLVHVDIYREVIVRDGLLGLHQPLSNHLQKQEMKPNFSLRVRGWSPLPGKDGGREQKCLKHLLSPCGCC